MGSHAAPGTHEGEGEERKRASRTENSRGNESRSSLTAGGDRRWDVPERGPTQCAGAGDQVSRCHRSGVPDGVYHSGGSLQKVWMKCERVSKGR